MAENTPAKRYTPEQKRTGLIAVLVNGSTTTASKQTGIPERTLASWRDTSETELYGHLAQELGPQLDQAIAAQARESVIALGQAERKLTQRLLDADFNRIDPRDIPNAIKSIVAAKAQNTDKLLLLTGRATERVEHVDARDIIADIQKIVRPYAIDSTATEEP